MLGIIKNNFKYSIKKKNFRALILFLYCFCSDVDSNFFICSFLQNEIFYKDLLDFIPYYMLIYTIFFTWFYLKFYLKNRSKIKSTKIRSKPKNNITLTENYSLLLFFYRQYFIKNFIKKLFLLNISALELLKHIFEATKFFILYHKLNFKNLFIGNVFLILYNKLFCQSYWYPIFKRYSYFGYFNSINKKIRKMKDEELIRFKY